MRCSPRSHETVRTLDAYATNCLVMPVPAAAVVIRSRARSRLLLGPTGAHERKRCRRPRSLPGRKRLRPTNRMTPSRRRPTRASAVDARARMVPEGTFAVGAGLAVSGVTTYGFQILAFRGLSKPDYAALNALWVFVFVLAPGVFLPLEQEVGRALVGPPGAQRRRRPGRAPRRVARPAFAVVLAIAIIVVGAARRRVVQNKFNGHVGLARVPDHRVVHVRHRVPGARRVRGRRPLRRVRREPRGRRHHPAAAVHPARDRRRDQPGLVRPVPRGPAAARDRRRDVRAERASCRPGPPAPWSELSSNLGYLLGGSLLAQVLSYAPFLGAQVLAKPDQRAAVADFIVGLFLSRLPILLFQAVQAALLPKLSTLVSAGRDDEFQQRRAQARADRRRYRRARRDRRRDDRTVRRPHPVRPQVQPRQRRRRVARGRQRPVHPGAHAVAGADRAARATGRRWSRGSSASSRSSRRSRWSRTRCSCGSSSARSPAPASAPPAMGLFFVRRLSQGVEAGSLASLVEQIEYGTLEI